MPIIVMALSIITLFLFRDILHSTYGFPYFFTWLIPIITFLTFCNEQLLALIRNNNDPITFLKANVSKTVVELGLSFILVVFFACRWQGRVTGIFVSYLLIGIYAVYYFYKKDYLFGRFDRKYLKSELIYAIPIIALQASIFLMSASDKFFLSNFTNDKNETVGIYSVACTFASIVFVFNSAVTQYVFPKIYTVLATPTIDYGSVKKLFYFFLLVMAGGTLCIIILTPLLYHLFINEKYYPALRYSYLLCIGYFLWSVSYFFYSFLLYHKQKKKILLLSCSSIIVSISCNYFFIKNWHTFGAALAVLTCFLIVLVLTLIITKEYWQNFLTRKGQTGNL
jgi:O-antigen/teichoic acid export membrane protein